MTTLITLISFLGFYAHYQASKKALLSRTLRVEQWMQANRKQSRVVGLLFLLMAVVLSVFYYGFGAGVFAFFVILMTVGSLIVLLAPLRFVGYRTLALILILALTFEYL
ncbi:hypothetical protein [Sinomicrobium weinanense]|uniref:DUF3325 domain-containing protein n=1 Tax=Sinomicrobium weinanense TaxID=2842200 RepID=A0A926JRJ3_9FLAO|nr:hypothetical protein [Sinomicrobium weinanense]MBC9795972.1 hypothetical protein [Sinomicrobium weinanense]MBU3122091.1 hypothetical protein [Sinomicrobium weinanense]